MYFNKCFQHTIHIHLYGDSVCRELAIHLWPYWQHISMLCRYILYIQEVIVYACPTCHMDIPHSQLNICNYSYIPN
jgi:hypothetical protein